MDGLLCSVQCRCHEFRAAGPDYPRTSRVIEDYIFRHDIFSAPLPEIQLEILKVAVLVHLYMTPIDRRERRRHKHGLHARVHPQGLCVLLLLGLAHLNLAQRLGGLLALENEQFGEVPRHGGDETYSEWTDITTCFECWRVAAKRIYSKMQARRRDSL